MASGMALVVSRKTMLDNQSTEGRRNTYRRRQSGVALLFSGILLTVLAGAVVVTCTPGSVVPMGGAGCTRRRSAGPAAWR